MTLDRILRAIRNRARKYRRHLTGGPRFAAHRLHPMQERDYRSLPPGWSVRSPDFVGVGTGKSGTTWWYSLLLKHPQVVNNRRNLKELTYFLHFRYRGMDPETIATYRRAFAAPADRIVGEWSPAYLRSALGIEYLAQAAPDTRLLIILRNPIDRLLSTINQGLRVSGRELRLRGSALSVYQTHSDYPLAVWGCECAYALKRLFDHFDRSQVLVLQYERCKQDPLAEIRRTYAFLGIDPVFVPSDIRKPVNRNVYRVDVLTADERSRLKRYYERDVRETFELLPEIEPALWPDFSD